MRVATPKLGTRLFLRESLDLVLEATRRQRKRDTAAHELALLATVPWLTLASACETFNSRCRIRNNCP